ncbi:hypothetical protein BJX64DRAFT_32894 [Aspergillus heterothallicus]
MNHYSPTHPTFRADEPVRHNRKLLREMGRDGSMLLEYTGIRRPEPVIVEPSGPLPPDLSPRRFHNYKRFPRSTTYHRGGEVGEPLFPLFREIEADVSRADDTPPDVHYIRRHREGGDTPPRLPRYSPSWDSKGDEYSESSIEFDLPPRERREPRKTRKKTQSRECTTRNLFLFLDPIKG